MTASITKQPIAFRSGGLALVGYLFKPEGMGPFPAVLWNHGSERAPGQGLQFDTAGAFFLGAGYALFAPVRRGHEGSEGAYIVDETDRIRETSGPQEANRLVVRKLETEQLDDQVSGLGYLRRLPFVDHERIVVVGGSYGGIQTLLGAARRVGYRAAVAISPAALSWEGNPLLRERLLQAVREIEIPVMILQPPKECLEPSRVLGAEFRRLGKPFEGKIYPPEGPEDQQGHCFGGAVKGMHIWAEDALAFLNEKIR